MQDSSYLLNDFKLAFHLRFGRIYKRDYSNISKRDAVTSVGNPRDHLVKNTDFSVYFSSIQGRTFLNISRYT